VKMAEVIAVDPKTRTVITREGNRYQGDFLVLAAGSQANFFGTAGLIRTPFLSTPWQKPSDFDPAYWRSSRTQTGIRGSLRRGR
jgi:hypothetical protein